jgi:hypothetical protein
LQVLPELFLVKLVENLAVNLYPLFDLDCPFQGHERLWLLVVDPCAQSAWNLTPPHRQDVLVSLGDDQATLGALVLEHRVCAGRGAMVDVIKLALPVVLLLQDPARFQDTFLYTNGLIGRVGRDFGTYCLAVWSDYADVGKGAARLSVLVYNMDALDSMLYRIFCQTGRSLAYTQNTVTALTRPRQHQVCIPPCRGSCFRSD